MKDKGLSKKNIKKLKEYFAANGINIESGSKKPEQHSNGTQSN